MPDDDITIRLVRPEDADPLRENTYSANTLAEVRERVAGEIAAYAQGTRVHLVAEVDGAVVGTGRVGRNEHPLHAHRAELYNIVVHPDYQRQGLARRIIATLHDHALSMGITILAVSCRGGTGAEQVYPRLGFVEWGRLPGGLKEPGASRSCMTWSAFTCRWTTQHRRRSERDTRAHTRAGVRPAICRVRHSDV